MAANRALLEKLHELQAESMVKRLEQDLSEDMLTDAATYGAINAFLKQNSITADPADRGKLDDLRDNLRKQAEQRKAARSNILNMVREDIAKEA